MTSRLIIALFFVHFAVHCSAQLVPFERDIFRGGVMLESTGNGESEAPFEMNIHLPTGCTIRKALLILNIGNQQNGSGQWQPFVNKTFSFENQLFHLNPQGFIQGIENFVIVPNLNEQYHYQAIFNVSHLLAPTDTTYIITPPPANDALQ